MKNKSYTIGIPVYERIFGFEEALQSALLVKSCTEILVIDDNSSHNEFQEICSSFNDTRVRYVHNQENIGLFGNWNKCAELANGEYISILCSDDLIEANAFELFLDASKTNEDIDVFFGSFTMFNATTEDAKVHRSFKNGHIDSVTFLKDLVSNGPAFPVLTIMKKEIALRYPFVSKPHSGNDWLWIYSNAMSLNLHATSETINYWRRHADQDAVKSQSITMDCWPMMFLSVSRQLNGVDDRLSKRALRRAKGVILSWLINECNNDERPWQKRILLGAKDNNDFINVILEIINADWLLGRFLNMKEKNSFIYNLGRAYRKLGYYPV
jgi:glycosyltransferase involved in cell wall biosynthesis